MQTPTVQTFDQLPAAMQWLVNEISAMKLSIAAFPSSLVQPAAPTEEYITRKAAAEKLHLSLNTLDTYSREGKLKAYRLGNRVLYKSHEIEHALTAMKTAKVAA